MGFFIPLGVIIGALVVVYAVCMVTSSPGPYPRRSAKTIAAPANLSTPVAAKSSGPDSAVASAEAGEGLYNIYCVACHQAEGAGKVGFAPFIRNHDFLVLADDEFLRKTIVTGRPGTSMIGWAHLKPHEIDSLILCLRSEEDPDAPVRVTVNHSVKHPGDATAGKGLYGQYCATCHGQNATGYAEGGPGPAIGTSGFLAVASDDYIFQTIKHGRSGTAMRPFSGPHALANLTDSEIANIVTYLRERTDEAPVVVKTEPDPKAGEMHYQANCAACHQKDGKGLPGFAPAIRNRDFLAIASDKFIKDTVHNGRPGTSMVQRPDLSEQTVDDIIAFLRAVPTETPIVINVDPTKDLASLGDHEKGKANYAVYCASCLGSDGKGYVAGGAGPAIGLSGFLDAASDDYIYQTIKLGRMGTAMKSFIGAEGLANLNDQDAHDIIAHQIADIVKTSGGNAGGLYGSGQLSLEAHDLPQDTFALRIKQLNYGTHLAGVRRGDIVLSADNKADFSSTRDFYAFCESLRRSGRDIRLRLLRQGSALSLMVSQSHLNYSRVEKAPRADLGFIVQQLPGSDGLRVGHVNDGCGAEMAGVKVGDRIVALDGTQVTAADALRTILDNKTPGELVTMDVTREGKALEMGFILSGDNKSQTTVARLTSNVTRPGQQITALINIKLPSDKHIYSMHKRGIGVPTQLEFRGRGFKLIGPPQEPTPKKATDSSWILEGDVELKQVIEVTNPDDFHLLVQIYAQVCDDQRCHEFRAVVENNGSEAAFYEYLGHFDRQPEIK